MAKKYIYTKARRESMQSAQKIHQEMVRLGKEEYYEKHKKK